MTRLIALIVGCLVSVSALGQTPLGTGFTYQGLLESNGSPHSGPTDLVFRLYTAASGGTLLGSQPMPATSVTDGRFNVVLNDLGQFSAAAFVDSRRWLEIAVNGVTLSPRQELTATPFALETRGIVVGPTGKVGIGDNAPATRLSVHGGLSVYDSANEGVSFASNSFAIVNRATEDIAYQYTVSPERHEFSASGSPAMIINAAGNVGIGSEPAASKLTVAGPVQSTSGGYVYPDNSVQRTAPRVALQQSPLIVPLISTSSWTTVRSVTINAPGAGTVLVTATGSVTVDTSNDCDIGIGLTPNALPVSPPVRAALQVTGTATLTMPYTVEYAHTVSAPGSITFYLVADSIGFSGLNGASVRSSTLNALFIPSAQ